MGLFKISCIMLILALQAENLSYKVSLKTGLKISHICHICDILTQFEAKFDTPDHQTLLAMLDQGW